MEEEAVSLALAAERLGVTRQRAQQLLRDGVLTGPAQPQGQRAVRNAPRVFVHSLEAEVERRAQRPRKRQSRSSTRPPVDAHLIDDINRLALAYASARDDHTAMREIVKRLTSQLADAYAALAAQQELLDHSAYREEQIASIITNHLGLVHG